MIDFVKDHIVYRFGIPQIITTNQGTMFTMLKLMGRLRLLTKGLLSSSNERLKKTLNDGIGVK